MMTHPAKTTAGREAMQTRDPALSARDRQIMVLANGQRGPEDMAALLGPGTVAEIERLIGLGFLAPALPAAAPKAADVPPARPARPEARRDQRAELAAAAVVARVATPPPALPPAQAPRAASRRSLAATKMYVIDVLQMIREPEAAALATLVHTSSSETELMESLLQVLERLPALTRPSFAHKVCAHLLTIVPDEHEAQLREHSQGMVVDLAV